MPVFEYKAVNQSGEAVVGTLHSASVAAAAEALSQQGLSVEHVGVARAPGDPIPRENPAPAYAPRYVAGERTSLQFNVVAPLVGRASLSQLQFFFRQLAQMLHAGVNPVQALDTLASQTGSGNLRQTIREMRDAANAGLPMSGVMQRYPEVYSSLMTNLVIAGEQAGILEEILKQIAEYIGHEIELRNLLRRVTFYPKLVTGFSIVLVLAVNAYIASMGKTGGLWSPLTDPSTWIVLGPLLIVLFLFIRVGLHQAPVKASWDRFLLGLPGLGKTLSQLAMAKFGRAFGTLYRAGIEPARAIALAADGAGNLHIRERILPAANWIKDGRGITESLRATGVFSPIVLDMTQTGETTGNLDEMLESMARYYEDEARVKTHQFGHVFGTVVYVGVAIYVFLMLLRFYSGYFGGMASGGD